MIANTQYARTLLDSEKTSAIQIHWKSVSDAGIHQQKGRVMIGLSEKISN